MYFSVPRRTTITRKYDYFDDLKVYYYEMKPMRDLY